jgi:hypothetical protein
MPSVPSSQKRRREPESNGSNKRVKGQPTSLEMEAIRQSALRAAGRLSHSFQISHAINLIIIGELSRVFVFYHVLT